MKKAITIISIFLLLSNSINAQQFTKQADIEITNVDEGSADWGDYNNDGLLDFIITGDYYNGQNSYSGIYKNIDTNQFQESDNDIIAVYRSSTEWGDYNNDNYLDIALTGTYHNSPTYHEYTKVYSNNQNETFKELTALNLIQSDYGSISWGDYNNDGFLDLLHSGWDIGGNIITVVYKNYGDGNIIGQGSIQIEDVKYSDVAWGDYNNDGFLDFVILGNTGYSRIVKIYKNNGENNFEAQEQFEFLGVSSGSIDWGDYNNDGFLDLIFNGQYYDDGFHHATKIYRNDGGENFTELLDVGLSGTTYGEAEWGDCNNDGFLDIILTGFSENPISVTTNIYINNTDETFSDIPDSVTHVGYGSTAWGDYDNDNDLDILLTGGIIGGKTTEIQKNNEIIPNIRPNIITNLQTEIIGEDVIFSWDLGTDDNQPSAGLNYNIYVYEEGSDIYIATPQAFPQTHELNGKRLIAKRGQIQGARENGRVSYIIKGRFEECKTYYWSVQAIDASFVGGEFAPEQSFYIDNTPPVPNMLDLPDLVGECSLTAIPPTAEDNCDGTIIATTTDPLEYDEQGNYQITWTYTDSFENTTEQTQTVIILDNTSPEITCPENITINLPEGQTSYIFPDQSLDPISYEDNCEILNIENNYNFTETLLGAELPIGTTIITWTATDIANNQTDCNIEVTVNEFVAISENTKEEFVIFPNPAKDYFIVKYNIPINKYGIVIITDNIGKAVKTEKIKGNSGQIKITTSDLANGAYNISLQSENKIIKTQTIVIKK